MCTLLRSVIMTFGHQLSTATIINTELSNVLHCVYVYHTLYITVPSTVGSGVSSAGLDLGLYLDPVGSSVHLYLHPEYGTIAPLRIRRIHGPSVSSP